MMGENLGRIFCAESISGLLYGCHRAESGQVSQAICFELEDVALPCVFRCIPKIRQYGSLYVDEKVREIVMYGMAVARIGSRPHDVGGPESCHRGGI